MSLLPPTPIVLSKIKHLLKKHLPEDEFESVCKKVGPFPLFILEASIRDMKTSQETIFDEIHESFGTAETGEFPPRDTDDCDLILNGYTRLKKAIALKCQNPSICTIKIRSRPDLPEDSKEDSTYSDVHIDSFPVGLTSPNELDVPTREEMIKKFQEKIKSLQEARERDSK